MSDDRPNPDALLAHVNAKEGDARRGSLKIFFGYAAGVGKTYSMLENARRANAAGRDVVVGYIEPHGRTETEALAAGLESVPVRTYDYRGVPLKDFDVDAALARHPELILVDELAHTNASGCRHEKRWQDIEELLNAGIDVWTTLNVQHIESLNDLVGQITGITVRETIPDQIFDRADDLELVDISPEELLDRLRQGKVYLPERAQRAIQSFFQRGNLTALRELSLRQTTRRVHDEVESARRGNTTSSSWSTADRLLVCIGPSPTTARVIRTAKRMAAALDAPWLAVSVDLTGNTSTDRSKQELARHFRMAERLGAETVTLAGQNVAETVLDFARSRNVSRIFIGKTDQPRWKRFLLGTVVDDLLENSGDIDVYVIRGEAERADVSQAKTVPNAIRWSPYFFAACWIALACGVAFVLRTLNVADSEANTVMVFLAAVAWTAFRLGRRPAIFASGLAVLLFDFFFVPPLYTFAAADTQYVVTFVVMLTIGLVISTLTSRLRAQMESSRLREHRTAALYELGKQLSSLSGNIFLTNAAGRKIAELLHGETAVYLKPASGLPEIVFGQDSTIAQHPVSLPTAHWVIDHDQMAGSGTSTLPNAVALFLPLTGTQRVMGAMAIRVAEPERLLDPDVRHLLEACAGQLALALERDQLAIEATDARIKAEAEQVRSNLLSSVSHDLKTPLAAIAGAGTSLLESNTFDEDTRRQLLETISEEALRLNRLLENILQMSKIEAGASAPHQQWHVLEEIIGSAVSRTSRELAAHQVEIHLPDDLPLLFLDGLLIEQVFVNLLENAARYTTAGSLVAIRAAIDGKSVRVSVSDHGPGLPAGTEEKIFDKFFRAVPTDGGRGSGLGLAICRAILTAHGGGITASNRPEGGAEFIVLLPIRDDTPQVTIE